jgi:hypothetical protein
MKGGVKANMYKYQDEKVSDLSCAMFSPQTKWLPGPVGFKFILHAFLFKSVFHLY